jgi:hypothetical protein
MWVDFISELFGFQPAPTAAPLTLVGSGLRVHKPDVRRLYTTSDDPPKTYIVVREHGINGLFDKHLETSWSFDVVSHALGLNDR